MTNICIDGNYFFYKTFGVFTGFDKDVDPSKILSEYSQRSMLIRKVATDLCSSLKELPTGGRLVFTMDSSSWRKKIEIEGGGYKSGRQKNDEVDWSAFFELLREFGNHLEEKGFIFSKVEGSEGDDLIAFWVNKFREIGENTIVISGDQDLYQLIYQNENSWASVWNSNSKKNILSVDANWETPPGENKKVASVFDMAFTLSSETDRLSVLLKKSQVQKINTKEFIFKKIVLGDSGDSVPSVWEYEKENKKVRFTEKKAEQLYSFYLESKWANAEFAQILEDKEFLQWISSMVLKISKDVDSSEKRDKVEKNYLRNVSLMWLNERVIPDYVTKGCLLEIDRGLALPKKSLIFDKIKILEGSDWITPGFAPKGFNPFEI
jgi:5'-3' exonuclease